MRNARTTSGGAHSDRVLAKEGGKGLGFSGHAGNLGMELGNLPHLLTLFIG